MFMNLRDLIIYRLANFMKQLINICELDNLLINKINGTPYLRYKCKVKMREKHKVKQIKYFQKKNQQSNKNSIDNRLMLQDLTNKYWKTIQKLMS